jgi:electron transfer flavoprotein beta subunit
MTNIVVVVKMVPDLVEELEIDAGGARLDTTWLRQIVNEFDDHAIEQAILLKEKYGGQVTILAPEADGIDDVLFTAFAKGADRLLRIDGSFEEANNHALARALKDSVNSLTPDLVLTGVQANDDLDGSLGPLLAAELEMPYVGYISGVEMNGGNTILKKEYPGGLVAETAVQLPVVVGIQSAETPPRYVAVSKVRQAMKEASVETLSAQTMDISGGLPVSRLFQPEASTHAVMLEGDEDEIAGKLVEIFKNLGVL